MKNTVFLLLALVTGCCDMCLSAEEKAPGLPNLRFMPDMLMLSEGTLEPGAWNVRTGWVLEPNPCWSIAWCEGDKARVTMHDAAGSRTTNASYMYVEWDKSDGRLLIDSDRWLPGKGTKWVRIKGDIPFAVSLQDAESKPVTVKLEKGFSVPVVLKGAGLSGVDGRPVDLKATLKVEECDDWDKETENVEIRLLADSLLGFRSLVLPVQNREWFSVSFIGDGLPMFEDGVYSWRERLRIQRRPEQEIKVVVRYAKHPRLAVAAVDARWALSGLLSENEGKDHGAGCAAPAVSGRIARAGGSGPGAGGLSATAALEGIHLGREECWLLNGLEEKPLQLFFNLRLTAGKEFGFSNQTDIMVQRLEVIDATGRVLTPAVFNINGLGYCSKKGEDAVYSFVSGSSAELPSAGAEWVQLRGVLRVMMHHVCESPVYELPLVQGAELNIPSPKVKEPVDGNGDVAQAGDVPSCRLKLEQVKKMADHEVEVKVSLVVEEDNLFMFDGFEVVDEKGAPVQVDHLVGSDDSCSNTWVKRFRIGVASGMQHLRLRVKYLGEDYMVTVPVDEVVGLGGPVPRKEAGKGAKRNR